MQAHCSLFTAPESVFIQLKMLADVSILIPSFHSVDSVDYLTCTDAVQAWGLSKSAKTTPWGAKRISELCCVKKPTVPQPSDPELKERVLAEAFTRILNGK